MKYFLGAAALLAASVSADFCVDGSTDDAGNWYCQEVDSITYTNVGNPGSYDRVTSMDSNSGICESTGNGYTGSLSPLNEEVSLHFRGPISLKQFAVYTPGGSNSKRSTPEKRHGHAHGHQHFHEARKAEAAAAAVEERQVGAEVYATIDGKLVSWVNEWSGVATSSPAAAAAAATPAVNVAAPAGAVAGSVAAAGSSSSSASSSAPASVPAGSWGRSAYYDASSQTSDGLVFLNHFGGTGSGVFDYSFGNSLSYASADGTTGSASPQVLSDITTASSTEVVIMSNQACSNGDCGYSRPGSVAYHGFEGANKAFFFEFGMPSDGQTGSNEYVAVNRPAIWMLNAQIPRTLQYGNPACSCWITGCGEFDIFEVLADGDWRAKSTLHGNIAGGDSDYFARPFDGTIKFVALMYNNNIHLKVLDSSTVFNETLAGSYFSNIAAETSSQGDGTSLFALAGEALAELL